MRRIVELDDSLVREAEGLVARVFPWRSLSELLTFRVYRRRNSPCMRRFIRLFGVHEMTNFWLALDEEGKAAGLTGLYYYTHDRGEAVWLAWFCVDPDHRRQGIGTMLMDHSIEMAKMENRPFFRLYTSDDPNEAAAQGLYEKYGFNIYRKEKKLTYTRIYRERRMQQVTLYGK